MEYLPKERKFQLLPNDIIQEIQETLERDVFSLFSNLRRRVDHKKRNKAVSQLKELIEGFEMFEIESQSFAGHLFGATYISGFRSQNSVALEAAVVACEGCGLDYVPGLWGAGDTYCADCMEISN